MPTHHLSIGDLELYIISDSTSPLEEESLARTFNLSPEDAEHAYATLPQPYAMSANPIYLHRDERHILIDVGSGEASGGTLLNELAALGVSPEHIDMVILTHLHLDHFGGLRRADGTASFPNAQVYVARAEWEHWVESGKAPAERVQLLKDVFALYDGRVHHYQHGQTLIAGVTVQALPGHTPGHHGVLFESKGKQALHIVDAVHVTLQFASPSLSPIYDIDPVGSAQTRRQLFERAVSTHLLTLSYHLPFPGMGYIARKGDGFVWQEV